MAREDTSKAADTGTAAGRLIELFHRNLADEVINGASLQAARIVATTQAIHEHPHGFPLADMADAGKIAARYTEDPRAYDPGSEYGVVLPELCEAEVTYTLDPDEADPTGEPIKLVGHLDQVRRDPNGVLRYWDIKATKRYDGKSAAYAYAWQLAAYALAASETLGEPVHVGGIILVRQYLGKIKSKRPAAECGGVWVVAPWTHDQCRGMLRQVAYQIGRIRAGVIAETPGPTCSFCPGGGPAYCGEELDDLLGQ